MDNVRFQPKYVTPVDNEKQYFMEWCGLVRRYVVWSQKYRDALAFVDMVWHMSRAEKERKENRNLTSIPDLFVVSLLLQVVAFKSTARKILAKPCIPHKLNPYRIVVHQCLPPPNPCFMWYTVVLSNNNHKEFLGHMRPFNVVGFAKVFSFDWYCWWIVVKRLNFELSYGLNGTTCCGACFPHDSVFWYFKLFVWVWIRER